MIRTDQNIYQNFNLLTSPRSIGIITMKNLFLVLFTLLLTSAFAQMPETADSIYWTPKYCDTSETVEDCYEAWTYNANIGCYIAGTYGTGMCDQLWPSIW